MYLRAAISFRACPAVLTVLQPNLIGFDRIPAANTVQSWVQGKVGRLAGVVSDQGADLVKGIGLLVEKQLRDTPDETATKVFKDFSHASSHIFKARLLADPRWTEFPGLCGTTQPRIKQTPLGGIAPPSQKAKGRYMNIGKIIEWGEGMMPHLVGEGGKLPPGLTVDQIRKHFGWLVPFRRSLQVWGQLHEIRERSLAYLRIAGYHATAAGEVKFRLASMRTSDSTRLMVDQIVNLVSEQSEGLELGQSYPASTEILESLIGKGKQMQFQNSCQGFTKMLAAMSAVVSKIDEPFVVEALETVREQDLRTWARNTVGLTMAAIRRIVLGGTKVT